DAIPWRHRPLLYYIHSPLQVRDGARVLIKAAGHPVLVRGKSGKGRVSVFAGTVCGERQPGDLPFWVWDGWPMILSRELAWLVKTPDAPRAKERITSRDAGYRKRLQELRKLTDVDLSAFGDEDDALAIGTPGGSGKPTSARILRLARHTTSREYALAVVKAVAESGTHIEPRGANAIFGQIEEHVVGSGFIQPGRVLASSDNAGRVALGMRVLARVDPGTARPYIMKYAKNGLEALSESKKGIAPELSGETLSGKDERLRLAAVRAAAECADPEFLRPFKRAVAGWHPSSSANPIVAKLQEDLEQEILVALCLMGDGKAAASVVQLMIQHDLAIEHNLDITQRPMYNRTPEKVRERKRARAQIAMLKARNRRLKAILARFPKSGIPRLSASAKEWQPLGSGYLQACLAVKEEEALGPASQKALQKILRECHLPDIRALCALQLRKADEAQFAETVLALSDSDRQSALFAISQMPHIQVTFRVRVIETALKRENQAVRTRAAWAILLAPVDQQRRLLKMAGTVGAEDPDFKRVLKCVEKLLENK
ncbi:MAG: hypothetical protein KGZ25_15035, partial [Planctomycetes bacterium]|nr:hypothetical protein [Planctomycetota bacterium]